MGSIVSVILAIAVGQSGDNLCKLRNKNEVYTVIIDVSLFTAAVMLQEMCMFG